MMNRSNDGCDLPSSQRRFKSPHPLFYIHKLRTVRRGFEAPFHQKRRSSILGGVVSVRNLVHAYADNLVLKDISFEVAEGEILAIMGSSGGGKTTLLRCISGLIKATDGQVLVDGIDVREDPEEARRHMGMVFQMAALFDYMNVRDNVLFGIRRTKDMTDQEEADLATEVLRLVGLEGVEELMPAELSGGMRKRVGIARAITLQPRVILYDEPTTGLDPITTYSIDGLILHLRKELGATSLVVSHDVGSVLRTADRVAFLHKGELIFLGTPDEFSSSENAAIRELVEKASAESVVYGQ
jgi:phospholipid/cholesterol/gamma-HCH transport system ATP-binding protein